MWRSSWIGAASTAMSALAPPEPCVNARLAWAVCLRFIGCLLDRSVGRKTPQLSLGSRDLRVPGLEEGPVTVAPMAQVVLDVAHAVDLGDVLDPALVGLVAHRAVQRDLGVFDDHLDIAQVEAALVLQPLHDHRPQHPVGRAAARRRRTGVEVRRPGSGRKERARAVHPGARLRGPIVAALHSPGVVPVGLGVAAIGPTPLRIVGVVGGIVGLAEIVAAGAYLVLDAIAGPGLRIVAVVAGVVGLPEIVAPRVAQRAAAALVLAVLPIFPGHGASPDCHVLRRRTCAVRFGYHMSRELAAARPPDSSPGLIAPP